MDTIGEEDWSDMKQKFMYNLQMRDRDGEPGVQKKTKQNNPYLI